MKILFLGDIFGKPGREAVKKELPALLKKAKVDLCVANIENIHHGKGVSSTKLKEMRQAGIDFFTSGNHIWRVNEIFNYMNLEDSLLLRPANYSADAPGHGEAIFETKDGRKVLIINVAGRVFMPGHADDPFRCVESILIKHKILSGRAEARSALKNSNLRGIKKAGFAAVLVDFHAEAGAEKMALAYFLDGKVSALIGTHTHIQTADERILPKGTAYLTDAGMNGPINSVIGVSPSIIVENQLTGMPVKHDVANGEAFFQGILIDVSDKTGYARSVKRIQKIVEG